MGEATARSRPETLVSQTVRDLVAGSDVVLRDRGSHTLRGFDGEWQLFALADGPWSDPRRQAEASTAATSGAASSNCSKVHEAGSRSGRHRTNRAGYRKRAASSVS